MAQDLVRAAFTRNPAVLTSQGKCYSVAGSLQCLCAGLGMHESNMGCQHAGEAEEEQRPAHALEVPGCFGPALQGPIGPSLAS